jgi:adenosylhomocysteine nucleosidase
MLLLKILVTFAVEAEFAPWRSRYAFRTEKRAFAGRDSSARVYRARTEGVEILALLTGIGWNASTDPGMLREAFKFSPDICISSGLAGALTSSHPIGEVLVARFVKRSDTAQRVSSTATLVNAAVECGASPADAFVTNGGIVGEARAKRSLGSLGDAVEMESYHVIAAAAELHIPCVAIRAISDTVEQDLPLDFSQVVDRGGRVRWGKMIRELGRHPRRIPFLVRFGNNSHMAATKLADFLDLYIQTLARPSVPPAMEAAGIA